jgi:hypothetical protein
VQSTKFLQKHFVRAVTAISKPKSLESRLLERIRGQSKQVSDIDRYFDNGIINVSNVSKNNWLFEWWNAHRGEYPQMYCAARDFLPLPASEVVYDCLFSAGRNMLGLRRHQLNGFEEEIILDFQYIT